MYLGKKHVKSHFQQNSARSVTGFIIFSEVFAIFFLTET